MDFLQVIHGIEGILTAHFESCQKSLEHVGLHIDNAPVCILPWEEVEQDVGNLTFDTNRVSKSPPQNMLLCQNSFPGANVILFIGSQNLKGWGVIRAHFCPQCGPSLKIVRLN